MRHFVEHVMYFFTFPVILLSVATVLLRCDSLEPGGKVSLRGNPTAIDLVLHDTLRANKYYVKGCKLQRQAAYDSSTYYFQRAQEGYASNNLDSLFFLTQIKIAENYRKNGKLKLAGEKLEILSKSISDTGEAPATIAGLVLLQTGKLHYQQSAYDKSINVLDKAIAIFRASNSDSIYVARSMYQIASSLLGKGNHEQAKLYYQSSLHLKQGSPLATDEDLAMVFAGLGEMYWHENNISAANKSYLKSLQLMQRYFGKNHPRTAEIYYLLGSNFVRQGSLRKALEYHNQALSIRVNLLGELHHLTTRSLNMVGYVFEKLRHYDTALDYYEKSLSAAQRLFDKANRTTAIAHCNIAVVQRKLGNLALAAKNYEKGLQIFLTLFGKKHGYVAQVYREFALLHLQLGDAEEAKKYINQSINIYQIIYSGFHSRYIEALHIKARIESQNDEFLQSAKTYHLSLLTMSGRSSNGINFDSLPSVTELRSLTLGLEALKGKAIALYKHASSSLLANNFHTDEVKLLGQAISAFEAMFKCLDLLKKEVEFDYRQIDLLEDIVESIEFAIEAAYQLHSANEDPRYLDLVFECMERSKGTLLLSGLNSRLPKVEIQIPDSIVKSIIDLEHQLLDLEYKLHNVESVHIEASRTQYQKFDIYLRYLGLLKIIQTRYPMYFEAKYNPTTPNLEQVRENLIAGPNHMIITYYLGNSALYSLSITSQTTKLHKQEIASNFKANIVRLRKAIREQDFNITKLFSSKLSEQIFGGLLVDHSIARLTIVPESYLGYLPFELLDYASALNGNERTTILNKYSISYFASCASQLRITQRGTHAYDWLGFAPISYK